MSSCVICGAPVGPPPPQHDAYAPPAAQAYGPPPFYPQQQMAPMQLGHPPQGASRENPLAVVSLVCGLFGLFPLWVGFVLCLCAIVFGILALQRAATLPYPRGRGLAIAGLVLGLVFLLPASCGL